MAELVDLKTLKPGQALVLAGAGWTVGRLATTDISRLTVYPGIGDVTAQKIIGEARQLINLEGLRKSVAMDAYVLVEKKPRQKVSARLQRIRDRKARGL